jgi:hypothetical protein
VAGEAAAARISSTSPSVRGDVRMPGQQRPATEETAKPEAKEVPRPEPLPPLPALTVAEVRAMLGMATLPEEGDGRTNATAAGSGATRGVVASVSASASSLSFDGYI